MMFESELNMRATCEEEEETDERKKHNTTDQHALAAMFETGWRLD